MITYIPHNHLNGEKFLMNYKILGVFTEYTKVRLLKIFNLNVSAFFQMYYFK